MKTKLIGLIVGLGVIAVSEASVVLGYEYGHGGSVTTTVEFMGPMYLYKYTFDKTRFEFGNNDLSNFYFNVCSSFKPVKIETSEYVDIGSTEQTNYTFKFDNISSGQSDQFWVSFETTSIPKFGDITMKYGKNVETVSTVVPSCNTIPETGSVILGSIGLLTLINRRKR